MSYATEVAAAISGVPHDWTEETRRRLIQALTVKTDAPLPDLWKRYFDEQAIAPGLTLADRFPVFSDYPFAYAALALPDA